MFVGVGLEADDAVGLAPAVGRAAGRAAGLGRGGGAAPEEDLLPLFGAEDTEFDMDAEAPDEAIGLRPGGGGGGRRAAAAPLGRKFVVCLGGPEEKF